MAIFAIDFEATKGNEVIAIGAVSNSSTFGVYVKPNFSKICEFIENLTGISQKEVDESGLTTEEAFKGLYRWAKAVEPNSENWHFICYGKNDADFVKTAIPYCKSEKALFMAMYLHHRLEDVSNVIQKFFGFSVGLMSAYNSIKSMQSPQRHDALEDAAMLQFVSNFINNNGAKPAKVIKVKKNGKVKETKVKEHDSSLYKYGVSSPGTVWPEGKFYAKSKNKTREFESIHEAIDWLLEGFKEQDRCKVNRNSIMIKIMKSIRTGCTYSNFQWYRIKQPKQALNIEDI